VSFVDPQTDEELNARQAMQKWLATNARNFTIGELGCWCQGPDCPMLPYNEVEFVNFVGELQHLRNVLGFPLSVNSGYRCPEYNRQIYVDRALAAGQPVPAEDEYLDGPHTKGAADIGIAFERMYKLVAEAVQREMGVGLHQRGKVAGRYIHVDNLGSRIWTY
jgi:hypothetical protein